MKIYHYILFILVLTSFACSPVKNTMQREWQKKLTYHDDFHAPLTDIVHHDENQTTVIINPLGVELVNAKGNTVRSISSISQRNVFSLGIPGLGKKNKTVTLGLENLEKVVYVPLMHQNAVLKFNYAPTMEEISLISLSDGQTIWTNNKLSWNVEKFDQVFRHLSDAITENINNPNARAYVGGSAGLFFPKKYIDDIITFVPNKNTMLITSLFGVTLVDLTDGSVKWEYPRGLTAGVSNLHYDMETESVILFGGNPLWFPDINLLGVSVTSLFQTNKDIIRLDYETGNEIWKTKYSNNFIMKSNGNFGNFSIEQKPDIRLLDDQIFLNFTNIELIDFNNGSKHFETKSGRVSVFKGDPSLSFAFPVFIDNKVFQTVINKTLFFGISIGGEPDNYEVVIEGYDVTQNQLIWKSDPFARQFVNNLTSFNNLIIAGFNRSNGVIAFSATDGSVVWEYPLSRRGVTTKWIVDAEKLVFAENDVIHILNLTNGQLDRKIEVGKTTGSVEKLYLEHNNLIVLGSRKGAAMYNINDGTLINAVKTGFKPDLYEIEGKYVLASVFPNDPIVLLNKNDFKAIGSLSKSKHRTAIGWSTKTGDVFEVRKGSLAKYRLK